MAAKQRYVISISVITVLILGVGGAVGLPSAFAVRERAGQIADERRRIDDDFATRRAIRDSASSLGATKASMAPLAAMSVQEGDELAFITAVEAAAQAAGVTQSITLETVNQKERSKYEQAVPVRIVVNGTFGEVLRFMDALERMPYFLTTEAISVSGNRGGAATAATLVDAVINATAYWTSRTAPDFARGAAAVPQP